MLERLNDHIRACYERSAQAEERAAQADAPQRSHSLNMANWWAHLARSYEFAGSLERFLVEADGDAQSRRDRERQAVWRPVATAPYDRDLRLAVLNEAGVAHALVFPCRRILGGWVKLQAKVRIQIDPTHWQEWIEGA